MFIQTEATPNPSTLKFLPGKVVLEQGTAEFRSAAEADASPLAARIFMVPGVTGVFFGYDFVTVTKDGAVWQHLKPAILGAIMESLSLMIILIPVIAPMGASLGIDPIQLGLVLVLLFTIGGITPPVGTITFTVCAITGCKIGEFTRAFLPFFLALLVCLLAIILFPPITTALPRLLGH